MSTTTASSDNSPNSKEEETNMILTERELTLIIEELEVDEEIYEQMIREEREKGNEPEPRHLEVLNLLNKLRSVRG
jgi:hypothetical protein